MLYLLELPWVPLNLHGQRRQHCCALPDLNFLPWTCVRSVCHGTCVRSVRHDTACVRASHLVRFRQELLHDVTLPDHSHGADCGEGHSVSTAQHTSIQHRNTQRTTRGCDPRIQTPTRGVGCYTFIQLPFSRYSSRPRRLASSCCSDRLKGHFPGSLGKVKLPNSFLMFWCKMANSRYRLEHSCLPAMYTLYTWGGRGRRREREKERAREREKGRMKEREREKEREKRSAPQQESHTLYKYSETTPPPHTPLLPFTLPHSSPTQPYPTLSMDGRLLLHSSFPHSWF